jgi:four helix bundle protein
LVSETLLVSEVRILRVFYDLILADSLSLLVYEETEAFPRSEAYGMRSQMRRAAVSGAAKIVEGSARKTQADFLRFLDIAFSSLRELEYYIHLVERLGYLGIPSAQRLAKLQARTARKLGGLITSFR